MDPAPSKIPKTAKERFSMYGKSDTTVGAKTRHSMQGKSSKKSHEDVVKELTAQNMKLVNEILGYKKSISTPLSIFSFV
jgi:hypothetical protein